MEDAKQFTKAIQVVLGEIILKICAKALKIRDLCPLKLRESHFPDDLISLISLYQKPAALKSRKTMPEIIRTAPNGEQLDTLEADKKLSLLI